MSLYHWGMTLKKIVETQPLPFPLCSLTGDVNGFSSATCSHHDVLPHSSPKAERPIDHEQEPLQL
jgi:hypothetical protein